MRARARRQSGRIPACVGLAALGLMGCGRASRDSGAGAGMDRAAAGGLLEGGAPAEGRAGSAASPTGSGGDGGDVRAGQSGSGGATGNGGTSEGGVAAGGATAGNAASAARAGLGGSSAGSAGLAESPAGEPGIHCGNSDPALLGLACEPGEVCVFCLDTETSGSVHCAPHPTARRAEYEAFSATCKEPRLLTECDGPEDCPDGSLCQIRADDDYEYANCSPEPPTCNAYCLACNSSADCADGLSCVPNQQYNQWFGATCGPSLSELLRAGDVLMGWEGGTRHYGWFRFSPGNGSPDEGTISMRPVTCLGCQPMVCDGNDPSKYDAGTYRLMGDALHFEFPSTCSGDVRLGNLASPPKPVFLSGLDVSGALVSAEVFATVDDTPLYEMLFYARGVACDADFTTCTFPPP